MVHVKEVRILALDNRGRIVIPQIVRKSLGLLENSQLMLVADTETKEMKIIPIGLSQEDEAVKFKITMQDIPGALAKIATAFANLGISMIYNEAVVIEKNKSAICIVISRRPKTISLDELKGQLIKKGGAVDVELLPLE